MATLVLRAAGTMIGGLFGPVGAAIGSALGGVVGASLDRAILAGGGQSREGPRLDSLAVMSASEGAPIPRIYGSMRLAGQVIWATELEEIITRRRTGPKGARQTLTEYSYRANVAIGLCEGPIATVRRVWADGLPFDLAGVIWRLHRGDEAQLPDPLITAKEGTTAAPAYRGLAYVVFEGLPLDAFGNRLPQFSFEVVKPAGGPAANLRAMTLIPGSGEFVYEDRLVTERLAPGVTRALNRHMPADGSDFTVAIDELLALCPRLEHVSLVVAWYGDDLRAGTCRIAPRVERAERMTEPVSWQVAGLSRGSALIVSTGPDGKPAYGGSPTDESVCRAIAALRQRGVGVTLYPFVMMDIPAANGRVDPWSGAADQPAYPWRGRITCDPAPGRAGTVDGTAAAATQIAAFFGTAQPAHFAGSGDTVNYSGPSEWRYRRFVLHMAALAEAAGGVDTFVIGSELIGLTRVRSASGVYPAVAELVSLAGAVRTMLRAGTRIVYGADWSDYGAHVLDGGAEVRFPLDPLFASPAIDAVALDWYAPLADWREGEEHLDARAGFRPHDRAYLAANIAGGEGFSWFYASEADRAAQIRTPITDGAYGKPWVFRPKDLVGWWSNEHVERVGGIERTSPTAWVPRSKPIWLLEVGCGAVDKGANRPSVFPDAKSSENRLPPFSTGATDPVIQSRVLEAVTAHWDATAHGHPGSTNPISPVYGGPMVDPARIYAWAWDARPFPAFPYTPDIWADSANHAIGHWLTGRLGMLTLDRLVEAVGADYGVAIEAGALDAPVAGAAIDRPMSARAVLDPLARLFGFDAGEREGAVVMRPRGAGIPVVLDPASFAEPERGAFIEAVRAEEAELARALTVAFVDPAADYQSAVEASRRLDTKSRLDGRIDSGLALDRGEAARRIEIALQDHWIARDSTRFCLPPSRLDIEPGDLVRLSQDGEGPIHLVTSVTASRVMEITARRLEPAVFAIPMPPPSLGQAFRPPVVPGAPDAVLIDLPLIPGLEPGLQWIAATASPWPGPLGLWRSSDGSGFTLVGAVSRPAVMGRLVAPLPRSVAGRWDRATQIELALSGVGDLETVTPAQVLDGGNRLAIIQPGGTVEVLQFLSATPTGDRRLALSGLLREQFGTRAADLVPAGATVVLVDEALVATARDLDELGRPVQWRIGPGGLDVGDSAMASVVRAPTAAALRPYAPVHVRLVREAAGLRIHFVRRTRSGGDGWQSGEVPLGEEREAYEIEILAAGAVKRVLATATSSALYAAVDEIADFGAPQTELSLRIFQISATVGRGWPAEGVFHV
ncbi:MAG: glycoside hydrolase/phage tail family protein [Labrys sp. (in: a-proteobacteria)]